MLTRNDEKRLPIFAVIKALEEKIISQSPGNPLFADARYRHHHGEVHLRRLGEIGKQKLKKLPKNSVIHLYFESNIIP